MCEIFHLKTPTPPKKEKNTYLKNFMVLKNITVKRLETIQERKIGTTRKDQESQLTPFLKSKWGNSGTWE